MRLWHQDLIPKLLVPNSWANTENAAPFEAMAGARSTRRSTMSLTTHPIASMLITA